MGYRLFFYVVPKKIVRQIQDAPPDADPTNYVEGDHVSARNILGVECGFEFGKYIPGWYQNEVIGPDPEPLQFFHDPDPHGDYECYVVGREGLLRTIEMEKRRVYWLSAEALALPDTNIEELRYRLKQDVAWSGEFLLDLKEEHPYTVAGSWMYKHTIFNLVALLKGVDWDEKTLIYAGW